MESGKVSILPREFATKKNHLPQTVCSRWHLLSKARLAVMWQNNLPTKDRWVPSQQVLAPFFRLEAGRSAVRCRR